jgi:uncharacterized protein (DUF3084 family)
MCLVEDRATGRRLEEDMLTSEVKDNQEMANEKGLPETYSSIIGDQTNSRFSATAQHVAARRARPASLQCPESPLRKRPSRPVHFLSLGHPHHIRALFHNALTGVLSLSWACGPPVC